MEITVPLDSKGDIKDTLLSPCIMHEVEHVFQYAKKIGKPVNDTYSEIYQKALNTFEMKNITTDIDTARQSQLALFVYVSYDTEQDAFANDLYSRVLDSPLTNVNEWEKNAAIYYSQAYSALMVIRDTIHELRKYYFTKDYNKQIDYYGKTKDWFISLGISAEKRLMDKMRKAITKAINDKNKDSKHIDLI